MATAEPQKCTHKGCEKVFTDPEEPCQYHPGAPIFHEGQKGWQCCKSRVLTFDEFLSIPPCTTGKHSTTAPVLAPVQTSGPKPGEEAPAAAAAFDTSETRERKPIPTATSSTPPPPKVEKPLEQDPEGVAIPEGTKCKRLACGAIYSGGDRSDEECVHHPGAPIFHEGSKGYSCCKRRVLEFDEFLKISGCSKNRHLFIGQPTSEEQDQLVQCRNDFYQTYTHVIVSIFAKKIDKENASIKFEPQVLKVDLPMPEKKRYKVDFPLYGMIDPEGSTFKIYGTKIELQLKKADGTSWPVLRSDEETNEIIQVGKPGTA